MFSLLYMPSTLIDKTNPTLTVENITNSEWLFRLGISGGLATQLFSILVLWCLFKLFYQEQKEATILMAVLNFIGMPIAMYSSVHLLSVFDVIHDSGQVMHLIGLYTKGTVIATIFWGLWLLPMGYLIIK